MKNKKKIAIGAGILSGCLILAGTFAWFSTTDKVKNIFDMDGFDVTITEDFDQDPDVPLVPGADITKNVTVTNNGNMDVLVRVKFEEMLRLLDRETTDDKDKLKITYTDSATAGDGQVPVLMSDEMFKAYTTSGGYTSYGSGWTSSGSHTGVKIYRKTTETGDNKVYSYLAFKETTNDSGTTRQVVRVTPNGGTKETPTDFTVEYAYHTIKNATGQNGDGATGTKDGLTVTYPAGNTKLDAYFGSTFHDAAVELVFDEKVQTDGAALKSDTTWYLADDGYFYYTKALKGNTISDPLLEYVSIKEGTENALQGATYELTPIMEAVQIEHAAVTANWTDLSYTATTQDASLATVSDNNQAGINQMIENIIKNVEDGHEGTGYYGG